MGLTQVEEVAAAGDHSLVRTSDGGPLRPASWKFVGCASDQPDDAPGSDDGGTVNDCVVAADGTAFKVRSERAASNPAGRRYAVTIQAVDACGNWSEPTLLGYVDVPSGAGSGCLAPDCGN